jgi:hypothetical protein
MKAATGRDFGRIKTGGTHAEALCVWLFKDPDVMGVQDGLQVSLLRKKVARNQP